MRVAAGAIAKKWLNERYGVVIRGYLSQLGEIVMPFKSWEGVNDNPFFAADPSVVQPLEDYMDALRKSGDIHRREADGPRAAEAGPSPLGGLRGRRSSDGPAGSALVDPALTPGCA